MMKELFGDLWDVYAKVAGAYHDSHSNDRMAWATCPDEICQQTYQMNARVDGLIMASRGLDFQGKPLVEFNG